MDWQVGDLALCVDDRPCTVTGAGHLKQGVAYVVEAVGLAKKRGVWSNNVALSLRGVPNSTPYGWAEERFRKIKPDTEPCEEEFTVLIKRMKPAKVGA